jgi:DNA repair protein RecN (Recombination protein N)
MLTGLSIRDVVLIDQLELQFLPGLTVLTGETGAGKSILLDGLDLALGARSDAGLIRAGAQQAVVAARFEPPAGHAVFSLFAELGIPEDETVVLRRAVERSGKSRAWINDAPVGAAALRQIGQLLVEAQGQHDQVGLMDSATHLRLLDGFGTPADLLAEVAVRFRAWQAAEESLTAARKAIGSARQEEEYLRHACDELTELAPREDEETSLAESRARLQQTERRLEALEAALTELAPKDRRHTPASAIRAASRMLQRLSPAGLPDGALSGVLAALETAEAAVADAEMAITRLIQDAAGDPQMLEKTEERLFALRAASRKYSVPVSALAALLADFSARLDALTVSEAELSRLEQALTASRWAYCLAAQRLRESRLAAARALEQAVARELPPLKLDRARLTVEVAPLAEAQWGPGGCDQVRFLIATNPGQAPGPIGKVASGGELSRLMLALKVVFASIGNAPTLIFDEVDSGVGGATAAAVGQRLARLAQAVQILVVTHSPQVAARAGNHLLVSKTEDHGLTKTDVRGLNAAERREEIARMLAGEVVTPAARAAASALIEQASETAPGLKPARRRGAGGSPPDIKSA